MLDDLMQGQSPTSAQWIAPIGVVTRQSTDDVMTEDPVITAAMRYIRDHFTTGIHVQDLLDETGVSRRSLEIRMKHELDYTPQVAIFRAQVERARFLLAPTQNNLAQIADATGFRRQNHFNSVFKRFTNLTPGQYRQRRGTG